MSTRSDAQTIDAAADGTVLDGGSYGPFDGVADAADWTFNESSPGYEGLITRAPGLEHRVVWEYALAGVSFGPPVTARLRFTLRGAPRYPAEAADVEIVAYAADLAESMSDFSAAPATPIATLPIEAYQPTTGFTVDASGAVSALMLSGAPAVGFRFQIAPGSTSESSQAFMDALDAEPLTKPRLTVSGRLPGDADGNGVLNVDDLSVHTECMTGPAGNVAPACLFSDLDLDADVDVYDVALFEQIHTRTAHP